MTTQSSIEWTEVTWNPIAGCTVVSPGCTNCYAMRMAARLQAMAIGKYQGTTRKSGRRHVWTGKINVDESSLEAPLLWQKPKRIFVNSMSDLFHESVDDAVVLRVWRTMERANWHTFQILTKRPERMRHLLSKQQRVPVLPNVWLGVSVENEEFLPRINFLRGVPAHIRFVSFEPLLGPIISPHLSGVHWAIVGGESGPKSRPIEEWWIEELRDSCKRQNVAFFFKQWGGTRKKESGRLLNGKLWDEYPAVM
jgi:protein gp37